MSRSAAAVIGAAATLIALQPSGAVARSLEDPPPGLQGTSTTLTDVLVHYGASEGQHRFHTRVEQWRVAERGLTGTYV
ncbi:MAG: hypothetical protein JO347_01345, partial [Candidatus Eremiobacteraeota bacterium]|nr:hypothetical protein [Candidatus Eremiobacteraeota bacterium]